MGRHGWWVTVAGAITLFQTGLGEQVALAAQGGAGSVRVSSVDADHILVRMKPEATAADVDNAHARAGVVEVTACSQLVPGLRCVRVAPGGMDAALAALRAQHMVMYAEPDHIRHKLGQSVPYGVTKVDAPLEWHQSRGEGVIVAHLDTGIDLTHPDLPAPALAKSFVRGVSSVQDGDGHGTHTAGTIVAQDNGFGVVGVAPSASLIVGKVLDDSGGGSDSAIISGIEWAVANHARVISMSLGGYDDTQALHDACDAAQAAGVLVVAAAGNDGTSDPSYPAAYPSVVSVAAINSSLNRASFSNYGPTIALAAPGVNVRSTYAGGPFATWGGTHHTADIMEGSGSGEVSGNAVFCGFGESADAFPPSVAGQIAHIRRGGPSGQAVTFLTKVQNAIQAGAVGVVISNNVAGRIRGTLNSTVSIPVLAITRADGDDLEARSGVTTDLCTGGCAVYQALSGTSMSCPHVAGVAALLFGVVPTATPAQVLRAMEKTALNLGAAGRDDYYGYGLVRADRAARYLRNHAAHPASAETDTAASANLFDFLQAWFAQDSSADLNADGVVDEQDVFEFVNDWVSGR